MILEQIDIKNFRGYKDTSIDFSPPGEKNVTLIYGENGAGKTSLFYAINWCFYGRIYQKKEIIPRKIRIDGKYLKNDLNDGESSYVSVKIKFSDNNERYNLERKIKVTNIKGNLKYGDEEVSLDSFNTIGQSNHFKNDEEEKISRIINSKIPVTTREYFFFNGEKIERFSDIGNNREIESSVRAVLGLDCIENAKRYVHEAAKNYDKLISLKGDDKYNQIVEAIQINEETIDELDEKITGLIKEKDELIDELKNLEKKLKTFDEEKENRKKYNETKDKIQESKEKIKQLTIDLHNLLKNSYLGFSIKLNEECKDLMKKWSDAGVFPSEVFNEELITKTLKKCKCLICGNEFNENDEVYKKVESLKSDELFSQEIEKELNSFNSNVKDLITKGRFNLKDLIDFYKKLNETNEKLTEFISKRDHLKDKITTGISDEEFKELFNRKHALETQTITEIKQKIEIKQYKKETLEENNKKFRKAKEKLTLKSKSEEQNKEKSTLCENAEEAIEHILKAYADKKRKQINNICKELFNKLIWKDSHFSNVELTSDYSLNVLDRFGEPARPDLSAGEREVLSLSFITSMAKSAEMEAPFIIDTPFGRISKKPRKSIAEQIPGMVSQFILFVTDTELTDESEHIFVNKSEKIWTIDFNQDTSTAILREGKHVD